MTRLKQRFGYHITAAWHAWCSHHDWESGDHSGQDRGDPRTRSPEFIERFLTSWHDAGRSSDRWASATGIRIDWAKEERQADERKHKGKGWQATSGKRGGGRDSGADYRRGWDRDDRSVRGRYDDR